LAGVGSLTATERGIYISLLCMMYEAGGAIPRDDERLARGCGARIEDFRRCLKALISYRKIEVTDLGLSNRRVVAELYDSQRQNVARQTAAREGWKKRKEINGAVMQMQSNRYANAMTTTTTKKELTSSTVVGPANDVNTRKLSDYKNTPPTIGAELASILANMGKP